jgi:rSAM/selenodomain-associated transferase 2
MKDDINVSVVIPTLNEQASLARCLDSIGSLVHVDVVISDGGSRDATCGIAEARPDVRLIQGPPGRGPQLNRGADAAVGDVLLFLHADCRLPKGWREMVVTALAEPGISMTCFRLHTEPSGPAGRVGRQWLRLLDLRSEALGLPYGDQGYAVRRRTFAAVGGFPDISLMEDVEFARACRRVGGIRRLPGRIRTTARRIERHPIRSRVMFLTFPWLFRAGLSPEILARWYGVVR